MVIMNLALCTGAMVFSATDIWPQSPKMVNTDAVEEENWEDEETRAPITPNYQSPEDYLKK